MPCLAGKRQACGKANLHIESLRDVRRFVETRRNKGSRAPNYRLSGLSGFSRKPLLTGDGRVPIVRRVYLSFFTSSRNGGLN
jgi:hypothetical protein